MGFNDKQVAALRRNLSKDAILTREVQGRTLSYIEGWHAIAEANRIFGFDNWDRETVETKCVIGRELRGSFHAVYLAKVRITVRAADKAVVREGFGSGEAHGGSAGETHERAIKTAETDATKRALATFGKPFGMSLYISPRNPAKTEVYNPRAGEPPIAETDRRRTQQRRGGNGRYYVLPRAKVVLDPVLSGTAAIPHAVPLPLTIAAAAPDKGLVVPGSETAALPNAETNPAAESSPPLQPPQPPLDADPPKLLIDWPKRRREPDHLRYVRTQPCLLCGRAPSDAHHLRFAQPRALGRKVSDEFTVPLCRVHHRQLHQSGKEAEWWTAMDRDVDPLEVAKGLWEESQGKFANPQESSGPPEATK